MSEVERERLVTRVNVPTCVIALDQLWMPTVGPPSFAHRQLVGPLAARVCQSLVTALAQR